MVPITPLVPLPHVAAPALMAVAPLSQFGLTTTSLPFESTVTPPLPTWSAPRVPTRLLAAETVPLTPLVPLPHVTAPASTTTLSQNRLTTTKLPFGSAVTLLPIWSPAAPRSVLISAPV